MAGIDTEREDIETYLQDNWTDTPISWDGVPYTPIKGTSYIAPTVEPGGVIKHAIPGYRYHGVLAVEINCPKHKGTKVIRDHADTIIDMLLTQPVSGVTFRDMTIFKDIVGEWRRWTVSFSTQRDSYEGYLLTEIDGHLILE